MSARLAAVVPSRIRPAWLMVIAVAILVLAWPIRIAQRTTVDLSWRVGLHEAAADGLRFGHDIVFTYGPLGFLGRPTPFLGPTSALAFVATAAVYLALVGVILVAARRLFPLWAAGIVTLLFARAFGWIEPFEALEVLAFALGVEVLRRETAPRPDAVAIAAGILAGVAILGKLNVGVFVAAMAIAVVLGISRPRWRGLLVLGVATAGTVLASWFLLGQQAVDLVAFARGSVEIISGYSEAMVAAPVASEWIVGMFALVAALVAWMAWRLASDWPRDRGLALAAIVVLVLFASWKYAVVRNNVPPAIVTLAIATLVLIPPAMPRSTAAISLVALGMAFVGVASPPPAGYVNVGYLDVRRSAVEFARQARTTLQVWQWDRAAEASRERLRRVYDVPPGILADLDDRSVHIDPYAAGVAAAYPDVPWQPVPVFQSYSAYTPWLDELNAERLRSPERPERILRQFVPRRIDGGRDIPYSVDNRFYWFESPAATLERLCRYRQVAVEDDWQALAATDRACGAATTLGTQTATFGEPVPVPIAPSPGDFVIVRIQGINDGVLARLRTALWRSPEFSVLLDGYRYRLVGSTAGDGLILAVPAAVQGSAPFSFGQPVRTIEVRGGGRGDRLTYTFEAVPLGGP